MKTVLSSAIVLFALFGTVFVHASPFHIDIPLSSTLKNPLQPPHLSSKASTLGLAHSDTRVPFDKRPLYYFGAPPYQKGQRIDEIRDLYKPMLKWLGDQVGCRFFFIGANTYEELITMAVEGKVHLAELGPVPYVVVKQQNPNIQMLLTELRWDEEKKNLKDAYHGYILVLKKRKDLSSLLDLKGKKIAYVNHYATSGYRYPFILMRDIGIAPNHFFSETYFLGSHPRVTDAIAAGSVDAGATWDFNWSRAVKKHGNIFKQILETPPIPNMNIVAHPSLPDKIGLKIKKFLPTIDPALLAGLPTVGFVIRPDSFYEEMRLLIEENNKDKWPD